jgi:hypothetical protein
MLKQVLALILSLLLFLTFAISGESLSLLGYSLLGLIILAYAINSFQLKFSWPHLLLPTFFLLAVGVSYAVISVAGIRVSFLIIAAILFYLLQTKLGQESYFLQSMFLLSVFGIYSGLFALEFYLNLNIWLVLIGVLVFTLFFTLQGFAGFELSTKKNSILLIVLIITQAALGLLLWPVHFMVSGVVLFGMFYLLWIFLISALFGKLTRNKVYWQVGLVSFALLVVLATAAWSPLFS